MAIPRVAVGEYVPSPTELLRGKTPDGPNPDAVSSRSNFASRLAISLSVQTAGGGDATETSDVASADADGGQDPEGDGAAAAAGTDESIATGAIDATLPDSIDCNTPSSVTTDAASDAAVDIATIEPMTPDDSSDPETVVPDDRQSREESDASTDNERKLFAYDGSDSLSTTDEMDSMDQATDGGSTDLPEPGVDGPIIYTFGGDVAPSGDSDSADPAPLHPADEGMDDSPADSPVTKPETPIIYTLDGNTSDADPSSPADPVISQPATPSPIERIVELLPMGVRGSRLGIRLGHDVNVDAVLAGHFTVNEGSQELNERGLETFLAAIRPRDDSASSVDSNTDALDVAFAGLDT